MTEKTITLFPLVEVLPDLFGAAQLTDILSGLIADDVMQLISIGELNESSIDDAIIFSGFLGVPGATKISIPGFNLAHIEIGLPDEGLITFRFKLYIGSHGPILYLDKLKVSIKFNQDILHSQATNEGARLAFEAGIFISPILGVRFTPFTVSLEPSFVAGTSFLVSADRVGFNLIGNNPTVYFQQLTMQAPQDLFETPIPLPALVVRNGVIGRNGFSGEIAAEWDLRYENNQFHYVILNSNHEEEVVPAKIFGLKGGIRRFALNFDQNIPNTVDIQGGIIIPYFEEPVDIAVGIVPRLDPKDLDVDFEVTIQSVDDHEITLSKDELIAISIQSLEVEKKASSGRITISGGLEPLLMSNDGLDWPRLDVKELSIEQNLADLQEPPILKFKEAWVDLKEMATLDLWGFHFELNKVGLGYEDTSDKFWIDLTGNIKLIEQIPVGVGVEGFRITWPRLLYEDLQLDQLMQENPQYELTLDDVMSIASKIEVKFDGVYLFYGVPQTVEFEGNIRFLKEAQKVGFAGDVIIRVPASGLEIEAGLMLGMNFEDPPYPFLYVYFGIMLPAGIPLGQSGLALKGAKGMFGLNVTPDKTPEQNWYYDWYKRGPIEGAHPTNKWRDERMAIALGAGVTITTADGKILGVQGLLVIAIPGPFLMVEGKALIFDGILPMDPPLKALGIFDGKEKTIQLNIEAGAELIEDMLEASGVLEAFFDFKDVTNWHVYLGEDQPEDRRVHAFILKLMGAFLFKADAYLMIDMVRPYTVRSRLGVFIGFQPPIPPMGPVQVTVDAVLEGLGQMTVLPVHFSGDVTLDATLEVTAFGFGVVANAHAAVMTEGPDPLEVTAELLVSVELPSPLQTIDDAPVIGGLVDFIENQVGDIPEFEAIEIELELSWSHDFETPELTSPVTRQSLSMESHFIQDVVPIEVRKKDSTWQAQDQAEQSLMVELDHRPTILFDQNMNVDDQMAAPIAGHPDGLANEYTQSIVKFIPTLNKVTLYAHPKGTAWGETDAENWSEVASTAIEWSGDYLNPEDSMPFFGTWRLDSDTENPEKSPRRILRLWSSFPFYPAIGSSYYQSMFGLQSQASGALDSYSDPFLKSVKAKKHCLHFGDFLKQFIEHKEFTKRNAIKPESDFGTATLESSRNFEVDKPFIVDGVSFNSDGPLLLHQANGEAALISNNTLVIEFPEPVRWVMISFCHQVIQNIIAKRTRYFTNKQGSKNSEETIVLPINDDIAISKALKNKPIALESEKGFSQLILPTNKKQSICIISLCYKTEKEVDREERAKQQKNNVDDLYSGEFSSLNPLLKPGYYYRLNIESNVSANIDQSAIPRNINDFLRNQMVTLGSEIIRKLFNSEPNSTGVVNQSFNDECYFQTEGPPNNIHRYVKWVSPQAGEKYTYLEEDLSIRFKRPYFNEMFAHEAYGLDVYIRSMDGHLFTGWEAVWSKASSETLTPDEHSWFNYLKDSGESIELEKDDVLTLQKSEPTPLDTNINSSTWERVGFTPFRPPVWTYTISNIGKSTSLRHRQTQKAVALAVAKESECLHFTYQAKLSSNNPKEMGVIFRYIDQRNYYSFVMSKKGNYQRLRIVVDGETTTLIEKLNGFGFGAEQRLYIIAEKETENTTRFVIELNSEVWGEYIGNDEQLGAGKVGLWTGNNSDVAFYDLHLTTDVTYFSPKSRYELIIAGGNGGTLLFGDSYDSSVLENCIEKQSGANWQIDQDNKTISYSGSQSSQLMFKNDGWNDVDVRATIHSLPVDAEAGYILRWQGGEDKKHIKVSLGNDNNRYYIAVREEPVLETQEELSSTDRTATPRASSDRTIASRTSLFSFFAGVVMRLISIEAAFFSNLWQRVFGVAEQSELPEERTPIDAPPYRLELRVTIFADQLKIFLTDKLIKTVKLTPQASGRVLLDGKLGLYAKNSEGEDIIFSHIKIRESELYKSSFMTSGFKTYADLIASWNGQSIEVAIDSAPDLPDVFNSQLNEFVVAQESILKAQIDYVDGSLDREQFEAKKMVNRKATAKYEAAASEFVQNVTGLYYQPLLPSLNIYLIKNGDDVVGIFLRSPEPLDLQVASPKNGDNNLFETYEKIGRTLLDIHYENDVVECRRISNAVGNQILFLPLNGETFGTGDYAFTFTYLQNMGDERSNNLDHRYDRVVRKTFGNDEAESSVFVLQL